MEELKKLNDFKNNPEKDFLVIDLQTGDIQKKIKLNHAKVNDEIVNLIARWREDFSQAYPTKFTVTFQGTKNWLQNQIIDNPDRFLFILFDEEKIIGHIGFADIDLMNRSCEIENVVKGTSNYPGLMTIIIEKLINYLINEINILSISVRVFKDNDKAIKLYEKCGFIQIEEFPMKKKVTGKDSHEWVEAITQEETERFFCTMVYEKK